MKRGPAASLGASEVRRWLPWVGGLLVLLALAWVLRSFAFNRFRSILAGADLRWLVLMPLSIWIEQLVRAWWRQLPYPLRPIGVLRLFGTIMAGYLLAALIPLGFRTIARSRLVARREELKLASVLATVALAGGGLEVDGHPLARRALPGWLQNLRDWPRPASLGIAVEPRANAGDGQSGLDSGGTPPPE